MNDTAIYVEGLSKQYRIGGRQERYKTLRGTLTETATAPFRALRSTFKRAGGHPANGNNTFWALKDVSFEIKRGEVVGVIGRNGAGKSTLLKILSRITEPTTGYADIHGRVSSLLEVGTGFHLELTGRENIYLNGAILGMKREEIDRKFDEIVEFAEVGKFIDTPVKHYSSGMHLRLAFAVAAHLEPDILLVDEVLAVGDLAFQRKCLGQMEKVAAHGRTVLFVSHNLGAVKELCQSTIVLNNGALEFRGSVVDGISRYSQTLTEDKGDVLASNTGWRHVRVNGRANTIDVPVAVGDPFSIEAWLDLSDKFANGRMIYRLDNSLGDNVVHQRVNSEQLWSGSLEAGRYRLNIELPSLWLAPGVYTLYFKFIGRKPSGMEERHLSERAVIDIAGSADGIGRANLAPPVDWTFARETGTAGVQPALSAANNG
jgi:lipopolysaccharide transport system ATP-binding protein